MVKLRKKEKLFGPACELSKRVLSAQVAKLRGQSLEHFADTKDLHSFICK